MQYTSNYHLSKPDSDDIINPNSRAGYNGNFDTLDTNLKSVSNKADTNESNITTLQGDVADLNAKTGDDIPFESESPESISDKINILYNLIVPVGSVLCFTNDTNPNDIYQGTTWEKIKDRFLLGAGDTYTAGDTGGEATHTLTVQEMPNHNHTFPLEGGTVDKTKGYVMGASGSTGTGATRNTNSVGGGQAHNNMPPYEVVNYWKRTA